MELVQNELVLMATGDWILLAVIISIFGTIGDLVESHLKRTANVKDSGVLIPGHGGVLDRFDGYLLAMPMAYTFVYIIYHL
jgi:phosphatidate cytidylyltransferase